MVFVTALFFILALVSVIFGFAGMVPRAAAIARASFIVFGVFFAVSLLSVVLGWA